MNKIILSKDQLKKKILYLKTKKKRIVLVHGVFDLVHLGFFLYLVDREDYLRCISEADRLLKFGGFLSIIDFETPIQYRHAYYKFYVFFDPERAPEGLSRDDFILELSKKGFICMQGTCSNMTHEKAFEQFPNEYQKELVNAAWLGERSIMFVVDHTMNIEEELQELFKKVF